MEFEVLARLSHLQHTSHRPHLRLYALVDGLVYAQHQGSPLQHDRGSIRSLFENTADAPLGHAGPWIVDIERADAELAEVLMTLEQAAPAVTWLIAPLPLDGMVQLLQLRLDICLPDGDTALLRFWDPRVLVHLAQVFDVPQREEFFAHIEEWHLLVEGRRSWIGRHADTQ